MEMHFDVMHALWSFNVYDSATELKIRCFFMQDMAFCYMPANSNRIQNNKIA